jgi:hypothetical protein
VEHEIGSKKGKTGVKKEPEIHTIACKEGTSGVKKTIGGV